MNIKKTKSPSDEYREVLNEIKEKAWKAYKNKEQRQGIIDSLKKNGHNFTKNIDELVVFDMIIVSVTRNLLEKMGVEDYSFDNARKFLCMMLINKLFEEKYEEPNNEH